MPRLRMLGIGLSAVLLAGCFAKVETLPALGSVPAFAPLPDPEPDLLVGLAISGGGSRAATFAAGVLEALGAIRVKDAAGEQSALEKVSPAYQQFFAAYTAAMQEDFEWPAAVRQVLFFRAFNPTKLAHSLAEVWDGRFFHGMTFAALYEREQRGDSPRVVLNGTSYNSGRRFALTTLPAADFEYDFVDRLLTDLRRRSDRVTPEGLAFIERNLESAKTRFLPSTFEQIGADPRQLQLWLGVGGSASFPPVVGPVTYSVGGNPPYQHIGDGGLYDNLGSESLTTVFLKKIPRDSTRRGLILVVDAAYPFGADKRDLDNNPKGFGVFAGDPSRIVGIMEERADAYQLMLWDALRSEGVVLPDFASLRVEVLRHTEATWTGYQDLPEECRAEFRPDVSPEEIRQAVSQIPTLFRITPCHGALVIKAAHKVVEMHRDRIAEFLEKHP